MKNLLGKVCQFRCPGSPEDGIIVKALKFVGRFTFEDGSVTANDDCWEITQDITWTRGRWHRSDSFTFLVVREITEKKAPIASEARLYPFDDLKDTDEITEENPFSEPLESPIVPKEFLR